MKQPANNRPLGPFARDRSLTTIDRRTKAGRVLRQVRADLTAQLGGDPSPAEALIIQSAAVKATRLFLVSEQILSGVNFSQGSDAHALAYLNSMRQDLTALGLKRVARDVSPSLSTILAEHAAERPARSVDASEGDASAEPASLMGEPFAADCEAL